jgi:hydroxymethylbilane synthase
MPVAGLLVNNGPLYPASDNAQPTPPTGTCMLTALPSSVRLGTRASALARWQADHIAGVIRALGVAVEIVEIATHGDLDQRTAFGRMDAKGVFTKEIEQALLENRIDLAVHSLKDLSTQLPAGLALAAVPDRESALDGWFCPTGGRLEELAAGARVATGSLRRQAQVLALRPDLRVVEIRGNVATRMEKIRRGEADATLLAEAGMRRLGLADQLTAVFPPERMTPAMGQGALGIEAREGEFGPLWERLNHRSTRAAVDAERAFLSRIGGGCKTPAGVYARPADGGVWRITALLASPDGRHLLRRTADSREEALRADAPALAEAMLAEADAEIRATLNPRQ